MSEPIQKIIKHTLGMIQVLKRRDGIIQGYTAMFNDNKPPRLAMDVSGKYDYFNAVKAMRKELKPDYEISVSEAYALFDLSKHQYKSISEHPNSIEILNISIKSDKESYSGIAHIENGSVGEMKWSKCDRDDFKGTFHEDETDEQSQELTDEEKAIITHITESLNGKTFFETASQVSSYLIHMAKNHNQRYSDISTVTKAVSLNTSEFKNLKAAVGIVLVDTLASAIDEMISDNKLTLSQVGAVVFEKSEREGCMKGVLCTTEQIKAMKANANRSKSKTKNATRH